MLKRITYTIFIYIVFISYGKAQTDCVFYDTLNVGDTLVYKIFDKYNQEIGFEYNILRKKEADGTSMRYVIKNKTREKVDGKSMSSTKLWRFQCINGYLYQDLRSAVRTLLPRMKNVNNKVKGRRLEYPLMLKKGDKLKQNIMTVKLYNESNKSYETIQYKIFKREVLEKSMIKTNAGIFSAFKISSKVDLKYNTVLHRISKKIEWYSPNLGTIKTEVYDKKGRFIKRIVLDEIKSSKFRLKE